MSDRDPRRETRYVLTHVSEKHLKNRTEKKSIAQYKTAINNLNIAYERRKHLEIKIQKYKNLNDINKTIYYVKQIDALDKDITKLNHTIFSLENSKVLNKIYKREDDRVYREFVKRITYKITLKEKITRFIKKKFPNIFKELCYKRIKRLHSYYECGAITEEEYNNLKQEILNKLN